MRRRFSEHSTDGRAYLVLSLDVELAWGLINANKHHLNILRRNEHRSRIPIDFLVEAFERHDIPCTWALVGHLFLDRCERENGIPHGGMPRAAEDWFSLDPCSDLHRDPLFYGKDIVERVMSSPVEHEIGYHSFSHVVFSRCSRDVARAEIGMSKEFAKEFGITFKSFVFPRNEEGHIDLLKEFGFRIFRGRESWRWRKSQRFFSRKINAFTDRFAISTTRPIYRDGIWEIPTCLHFWNARPPLSSLWQAKLGIRKALKEKKIFTIYLHPWDLLRDPTLKNSLEALLDYVRRKREEGRLSVVTMGSLSSILDGKARGTLTP